MPGKVIEYIRTKGLESLKNDLAINIKRHSEYDNLVMLKYNQIESPMANPIVQKCRGIILDEADDWRIVSYPYDKFFNYGEGHAAKIDWSSARVYEKLDGSLMTMYFYDGKWQVASSGLPDASGEVMGTDTTFRELFWKVWDKLEYSLFPTNDPKVTDLCFMFELMTPYNRVVVRHEQSKIVLHGVRRLSDFRELNPIVVAHQNGWECVGTHPLQSWEDVEVAAKALEPMESEGYVICDGSYNRVKVKSPQYVAVAHMKDGFTTRRMLEIVRTNENSEFLSYYPEYTNLYIDIRSKFDNLVSYIQGYYDAIKDIDQQKDFAKEATKTKYSGPMFALRHGKYDSIRSYMADMNIRNLEQWLGLKSIEL